jgi:hypothetical protein
MNPSGPKGSRALRGELEAAIERAIAALDALDGDCEDEGWDSDTERPDDDISRPEFAMDQRLAPGSREWEIARDRDQVRESA